MADESEPPLTEPVIVSDIFATGVDVERVDGEVRLIAWVTHSDEHRMT